MLGFPTSNDYPTAELAKQAINMAVATRGGDVAEMIFHPDKGTQVRPGPFPAACRRLCIQRLTGRTGNALDNTPAASFFSTLQHELIDRRRRLCGPARFGACVVGVGGWGGLVAGGVRLRCAGR